MVSTATLLLLVTSATGGVAPIVSAGPSEVCLGAAEVSFVIENPGQARLFVALSIHGWSEESTAGGDWLTVQEDVTQREAFSRKVFNLEVAPRAKRQVTWQLGQRIAPSPLVAGKYRLLVTYSGRVGHPIAGRVFREFLLKSCAK